ncbi:MAG: hypothetical protein ACKVSF_11150 [Alphaproteobacteria bacterium]
MAVVTTKATLAQNFEADPPVLNAARVQRGRMRTAVATVEVAVSDDDTSRYVLMPVHSSWRIAHIWLYNDAIAGGSAYDVGLYETTANGGAAIDDDCYATAIDCTSARSASPIDAAFEARDIANVAYQVWQDAGQSSDPSKFYYLALTADTVGTAAGTITVQVEFAENA